MLVSRERADPQAAVVTGSADVAAAALRTRAHVAALGTGPLETGTPTSVVDGSYNGKIDRPRLLGRALDAAGLAGLADGAGHDGALTALAYVNSPLRRVTGPGWSGRALDWRVCPDEYQAVWYHDDDLADACWPPAFAWRVPDDARSGMYAARLTAGDREDVISFYVRPAAGARPAPLAVLVPTFTYTIYANFYHPARWVTANGGSTEDEAANAFLGGRRELGLSLYCKHRDGSGVAHVSARRPWSISGPGTGSRREATPAASSAATCTCWTGWSTRASSTTPSPTTTCTPRERPC